MGVTEGVALGPAVRDAVAEAVAVVVEGGGGETVPVGAGVGPRQLARKRHTASSSQPEEWSNLFLGAER